jgi:hypothetical protein
MVRDPLKAAVALYPIELVFRGGGGFRRRIVSVTVVWRVARVPHGDDGRNAGRQ